MVPLSANHLKAFITNARRYFIKVFPPQPEDDNGWQDEVGVRARGPRTLIVHGISSSGAGPQPQAETLAGNSRPEADEFPTRRPG